MQIFARTEAFQKAAHRPLVLALGNFDGLHLGHQKILRQVTERASREKLSPAVFTFQENPQKVLRPDLPPPAVLLAPDHKLQMIQQWGIEVCFFMPFTSEFSKTKAEIFVGETLVRQFGMKVMCLGYNAHFGYERKGNPALMKKIAPDLGFAFEEIGPVSVQGEPVSSSRIRKLIAAGNLEEAKGCLGRPFSLLGKVVPGDGRGKQIGFPTANLKIETEILPPLGVYPVRVREVKIKHESVKPGQENFQAEADPKWRDGVLNFGHRPTFGAATAPVLEVFLMDFQGDLYGKTLEVLFYPRLRAEQTFSSPEGLKQQISQDVQQAGSYLKALKGEAVAL